MQVKKEITRGFLKYFKLAKTENTTYQNLQHEVKTELMGKFIASHVNIRKEKRSKLII
jgi:hypothetical protein